MSWNESPTVLTAAKTLLFGPDGNDTTGDGTEQYPFRLPDRGLQYLNDNFNLNGRPALIQATGPADYDCSLSVIGRLRGQTGDPTQITIRGAIPPDLNKPRSLNPESCTGYKWSQNPGGASALTAAYGACLTVEGFLFDKKRAVTQGTFADQAAIMVNVGSGTELWMGTCAFGYDSFPGAPINAQSGGRIQLRGNLGIFAPVATATAVALDSNSFAVQLANLPADFPLFPKCGVRGTGIPGQTWIEQINGTTIVLNKKPSITAGETVLTFTCATTSLVGIGDGSRLYHETGGLNGRGYISLSGFPHFVYGALFASDGAISWAGVPWYQRETWQTPITFSGTAGSNVITVSSTSGYTVNFTPWTDALPPNTRVTAINGNQVTLNQVLYRNVSDEPIRFGAQPCQLIGPKASAWHLGGIITGGYRDMIPGTMPVWQEANGVGTISTGGRFD